MSASSQAIIRDSITVILRLLNLKINLYWNKSKFSLRQSMKEKSRTFDNWTIKSNRIKINLSIEWLPKQVITSKLRFIMQRNDIFQHCNLNGKQQQLFHCFQNFFFHEFSLCKLWQRPTSYQFLPSTWKYGGTLLQFHLMGNKIWEDRFLLTNGT